jgi:hypothetical protein
MHNLSNNIDISILPEEAKKKIQLFYQSLLRQYVSINSERAMKFENIVSHPITVEKIIIPSRDDLYEKKGVC